MKKSKKLLSLILASIISITALASCSGDAGDGAETSTGTATGTETAVSDTASADTDAATDKDAESYESVSMRVFAMNGPTGMGMAKLMLDDEEGNAANDYEFTLVSSADDIKAEIIKGEYEIAAVPTNLAAVLHQKTEGALKIAAVNTLGVLYILENGETINSISDLEGKTIAATGEGSVPEYVLSYILKSNNVNATVEYYTDGAELATKMISGDVSLAMLPVPYATNVLSKSENVRIALDVTKEWENTGNNSGSLCQGCVIVRADFAEQNPEAVDKFLEEYAASVNYVNNNVTASAVLLEQYGIVSSFAVGESAIPAANIVCVKGHGMTVLLDGFYKVLFDSNPASVGGVLPENDIYYIGQ